MTAPTTPNAELAWQAYAVATKFERLDMDTWCDARQDVVGLADLVSPEPSCGTTACLAGWGAALAGYRVTWRGHILRQSGVVVSTNIETFMARLWGITDSAAAILFHVDNEDVEEEMVRVFGPRPGSFGSGCRCDYLGKGTPEHTPSALCRSLRPDAARDGDL